MAARKILAYSGPLHQPAGCHSCQVISLDEAVTLLLAISRAVGPRVCSLHVHSPKIPGAASGSLQHCPEAVHNAEHLTVSNRIKECGANNQYEEALIINQMTWYSSGVKLQVLLARVCRRLCCTRVSLEPETHPAGLLILLKRTWSDGIFKVPAGSKAINLELGSIPCTLQALRKAELCRLDTALALAAPVAQCQVAFNRFLFVACCHAPAVAQASSTIRPVISR